MGLVMQPLGRLMPEAVQLDSLSVVSLRGVGTGDIEEIPVPVR